MNRMRAPTGARIPLSEGEKAVDFEQDQVETVVNAILEDYRQGREIDRIDLLRRPDRQTVIDITEKLRRIVFPGFGTDKNYRSFHARHNLSMLMEDVLFRLSRQIALAFQAGGMEAEEAQARGQTLSLEFFRQIPQVRGLIQTDLQATYDGDPAATGMEEIMFSYPGLFAILVYRLAHGLHTLGVPILPRMMTEHAHSVTGIDIHPGARIGSSFFIDHGTGIVIGETTVIGQNVKLYQGVTLGALTTRGGQSLRGKRRHPTIEDNVTIYAGASILGGETVIGAGSVIGSNAFITHSIAPNTTVRTKNQELQYISHAEDRLWE